MHRDVEGVHYWDDEGVHWGEDEDGYGDVEGVHRGASQQMWKQAAESILLPSHFPT